MAAKAATAATEKTTANVAAVQRVTQSLYGFDPQAVETIKNTVAKGATDTELALFLYTARKLGLDPLLGQIWFVKYGQGQPSIQVGRDGLLATAQKDEGYETPISQAVYSNDEFELDVAEGKVRHVIRNPKDRGVLVGAYCVAPHKTRQPVVTWVSYEEYMRAWGQRNPVWRSNPAEMTRKVAESQSLRRQYANTGLSAVHVKDEFGPGVDSDDVVAGEVVPPPRVTREEVDALISRAQAAGMTLEAIKLTFKEATGRATVEGWSRDRAEFERWAAQIDEWIAARAAVAAEQANGKAQAPKGKSGEAEAKSRAESRQEEQPKDQPAAQAGTPSDPITGEQRQRIVDLCAKLQEPGGVPLAWLKKTTDIEDVTKLTQGAAEDLILCLEEQVAARAKAGQQPLL